MVKIYCPKCHQDYDLEEYKEGQHVECAKCKHKFTLSEDVKKPPEHPKATKWSKPGLASVCHAVAFALFLFLALLVVWGIDLEKAGIYLFAILTLASFGSILTILSKIEFKIGSNRE